MKILSSLEFRKRKLKTKVIFEVRFDGKWKSTGQSTLPDAAKWVSQSLPKFSNKILFKDYGQHFFHKNSLPMQRRLQRGKTCSKGWLAQSQSRLEAYLLPYWGQFYLHEITPHLVDRWLVGFKSKFKQQPSASTRNKVLDTLRTILHEAKLEGFLIENPASEVEPFISHSKERSIFTEQELGLLFPQEEEKLVNIWGSLMWACYFLVLRDTGHRMGEQAVLTWDDLYQHKGAYIFIINKSMDWYTRETKVSTKTGYNRATRISQQSYDLLQKLKETHPYYLIFSLDGRRGIISETARKHLNLCAHRAGVILSGRTPYCFRHTANTNLLLRTNPDIVRFLMGHRSSKETLNYNHPNTQLLLQRALSINLEGEASF